MNFITKNIWKIIALLVGAGVILMAIGLVFGANMGVYIDRSGIHLPNSNAAPLKITELDVGAVTDIDISVSYMDIEFKAADRFGLDIAYYGTDPQPQWSIENGVLRVRQESAQSVVSLNFGFDYQPSVVTIYAPAGTQLERVRLATDSGNISLGDIRAGEVQIHNSYGDVSIANLESNDLRLTLSSGRFRGQNISAQIVSYTNSYGNGDWQTVSAGSIEASVSSGDFTLHDGALGYLQVDNSYGNITAANLATAGADIKASSGDVSLSGDMLGQTKITSSYGDVKFSTATEKAQYSYDIYTDYGKIVFDGEKMGDNASVNSGSTAANDLKINCSSGDIEVYFGQ